MFESIILFGPGDDLYPLLNAQLQISSLPILNKPLLEYNVEFLLPVSRKIYLVVLEENINSIKFLISKYREKVEIVGISCYNGIVESIKKVSKLITTENIIVTKGDLITNINIKNVIDKFLFSNAYFLTILAETKNESVTVGVQRDKLILYNTESPEEFPENFFKNGPVTLSKELDTVQLYIFNKMALSMFEDNIFRFKHSLFPKIVEELREVKPVVLYSQENSFIYQIKDKEMYFKANRMMKASLINTNSAIFSKSKQKEIKQYIKKHALEDIDNVLGRASLGDECIVINSVIGNNVELGDKSKIYSSIVMDNVKIGEDSVLDNCIIGTDVLILSGSSLIDCVVSPGYQFKEKIKAENELFSISI